MISKPTLKLYRRHSASCKKSLLARTPPRGMTQKRFLDEYEDCYCAVWIGGTNQFGQAIERQTTKAHTFEAAKPAFIRLNSNLEEKPKREPKPWVEARKEWDVDVLKDGVEESTRRSYNQALDNLEALLRGGAKDCVATLDEVNVDLLLRARSQWLNRKDAPLAASTIELYLRTLSTFFSHAVGRKWIEENPVSQMSEALPKQNSKKRRAANAKKKSINRATPIDEEGDQNWWRIHGAVLDFIASRRICRSPAPVGIRKHPESWLALLELMYYTGLRVSDAIHFRPHNIVLMPEGGEYTCTQIKTGDDVTVFLYPWLVKKLRSLPVLKAEQGYCFLNERGYSWDKDVAHTNWEAYVQREVRHPLKELGKQLGFAKVLRPHRFRDSFAVALLNTGHDIKDVSMWLGHKSVAMTEKYYDHYNKNRRAAHGRRFFSRPMMHLVEKAS